MIGVGVGLGVGVRVGVGAGVGFGVGTGFGDGVGIPAYQGRIKDRVDYHLIHISVMLSEGNSNSSPFWPSDET